MSILTVAFFRANTSLFFASLLQPRCALHIHMVLSHWYAYIPSVMSSASAVGIIVAQGNELFELGSLNEMSKGQEEAMIKTVSNNIANKAAYIRVHHDPMMCAHGHEQR